MKKQEKTPIISMKKIPENPSYVDLIKHLSIDTKELQSRIFSVFRKSEKRKIYRDYLRVVLSVDHEDDMRPGCKTHFQIRKAVRALGDATMSYYDIVDILNEIPGAISRNCNPSSKYGNVQYWSLQKEAESLSGDSVEQNVQTGG